MDKQCVKNAAYLSKTSQNDHIECMGNNILTKILDDGKANRFFGLEADEVTVFSLTPKNGGMKNNSEKKAAGIVQALNTVPPLEGICSPHLYDNDCL